jgi:Flp pilus assembly protein TadD
LEGNTGNSDYSLQQEKNVLSRFGLDLESKSISFDKVTARMSNSVVGDRILGVLDELLMYERKVSVLELLRQLDSDPFRDAMREAVIQADDSKITELSGQAAASQQPPRFIINFLANHNAIAIERRKRFLEEAVIRYPSDVSLLVALYLLSLQINDADESLRWAQAAVSANPNIPVSLEYLANSLDRKKDWESAITLRRKAISLSPNYAIAHMHLGSALSQIGDLEGAEAELRTAVELYPELFGTHFNLGAFLCDKKT